MATKNFKALDKTISKKFGIDNASDILADEGVKSLVGKLRKAGARRKSFFKKDATEDIIELLEAVLAEEADAETEVEEVVDSVDTAEEAVEMVETIEALEGVVEALTERVEELHAEMAKMRAKMSGGDEEEEREKQAKRIATLTERIKSLENAPRATNRKSYDDDEEVIDLEAFAKKAPANNTTKNSIFGDLMK